MASRVEIHYVEPGTNQPKVQDFLLTAVGIRAVLQKADGHDQRPRCEVRFPEDSQAMCRLLKNHEGQHTVENYWGFGQALVWDKEGV